MNVNANLTEGGLAEVTIRPIDRNRTEVRLGSRHFFDLVKEGDDLVAEYKSAKRETVFANPNDLIRQLALLLAQT